MNVKSIFFSHSRLRSGWRILIFLMVSFPPLYYLTLLFWDELLIRYFIIFWLLLILSFIAARYLDRRPIGTVGYLLHSRWLKEYVQGMLIGVIAVSLIFFFEMILDYLEVSLNQITLSLLFNIFVISLFTTLFQSAFEELFFRGYIFQNLIEATNPFIATILLSALFGLGHPLTPNASWIVAINLTAFGAMHALGYLRTKSLFLPSGLHFGWNFFMRNIYSLPVSGTASSSTLLIVKESGTEWITGGKYGPEAGVPALLLIIACSFFIYFWPGIKVAPEMRELWDKYNKERRNYVQ